MVTDAVDGVVRGMMSNHGGLELIEDGTEMEFIGYWRRDVQPELAEFLSDHDIDAIPESEDDDDEEEEEKGGDDAEA